MTITTKISTSGVVKLMNRNHQLWPLSLSTHGVWHQVKEKRWRMERKRKSDDVIWIPVYCYARNHILFSYMSTNTPPCPPYFHLYNRWSLPVHLPICIWNINILQYWTLILCKTIHVISHFHGLTKVPSSKILSHCFSASVMTPHHFTPKWNAFSHSIRI